MLLIQTTINSIISECRVCVSHISLHSLLPVTYAVVLQGRGMESSVLEIRVAASALLRSGRDNGLTHPSVRTLHLHTHTHMHTYVLMHN